MLILFFIEPSAHAIDMQLPGFEWLEAIEVDTFGRKFSTLVPRSQTVLQKINKDWRLSNTLKLLVEVGLQNGGRQVTVRSLFSVMNKTSHNIYLILNPDPTHDPISDMGDFRTAISHEDAEIEPGELFQVPVLLTEKALRQDGNHLGSLWLCPNLTSPNGLSLESFLEEGMNSTEDMKVSFTTRPVQLAKLVSESALIFESQESSHMAGLVEASTTGVHVCCPVVQRSRRLSPFCYAVEVKRSPLVKHQMNQDQEKHQSGTKVHGPVTYTLSIHPTFVIVNLLPERGRFELMHAVQQNVVWFADLNPGQQVSIHSVGLDAPLLLLLNLGFCKTPVGEGALVHHGVDPPRNTRGNCCCVQYAFSSDSFSSLKLIASLQRVLG